MSQTLVRAQALNETNSQWKFPIGTAGGVSS